MAHTIPNNPGPNLQDVGVHAGWLRLIPRSHQVAQSRFDLSMVLPVPSSAPKVQRIFIALCGAGYSRSLPKPFPGSSVERVERGLFIARSASVAPRPEAAGCGRDRAAAGSLVQR